MVVSSVRSLVVFDGGLNGVAVRLLAAPAACCPNDRDGGVRRGSRLRHQRDGVGGKGGKMKFKNGGPPLKRAGGGSVGPVKPYPFLPVGGNDWSTTRKRVVDEEPDLPLVKRFIAWPDGSVRYWEW